MSGETPPSFAALRFIAIGRSLRDRLSTPDPQVQTAQVDDGQEKDDLYVDIDMDVEIHPPGGDEPRLLPDHSSIDAQDAQVPSSSGVASLAAPGQRTDPTLCITTSDPALSNSRDNASIHIDPIAAQDAAQDTRTFQGLPTPPPSGASAPLHINEQLQSRTTDVLFSPFPYTPLNELLQEERDAWGEVWKSKLNQAGSSFTSVHATDFLLSLPRRSQAETSTSDMPSIPRNEVSVPSDPPIRNLSRKEDDKFSNVESTLLSISHDRHPSVGKKVDGPTSRSEPSQLLVPSAINPAIERDSLSHPATLQSSRSESANVSKRHQVPDSDENGVRVNQQAAAAAHSVDAPSPREHELKAVLKARKSSHGPKDVTNTNQRHSLSETCSLLPTQKPESMRDQSCMQSQVAGLVSSLDDGSGRIGLGTAPSCLHADQIRTASKEDAPYDKHVLEAQSRNPGASGFKTHNTSGTIADGRGVSMLQPSRPIEGDDTVRASKRQAKKSEASLKTASDGSYALTIQSTAKTERTPSLPAKPTFDIFSRKPTLSESSRFPRTGSSAVKFKRSRSPGIKSEPADGGGPVHEPSSRPSKRMKEAYAAPGSWVKKEETEENISETSTSGDLTSVQDARTEPQETNMRSEGDEYPTGGPLQDQQSRVRDVSTLQALPTATHEHPEAGLSPRTVTPQSRAVLTQQEQVPKDDITHLIPGLGTAIGPSSSNIGCGDHDTPDSEMRTVTPKQDSGPPIGKSPLRAQADDSFGRRNYLHSETKRQRSQERCEQTARSRAHSSQPLSSGPAFPTPNEGRAQQTDITIYRSPIDTSVSDNRRRTSGGSPQSRGRSRESRPMSIDHWSPPRPATAIRSRTGNIVVDTYIPSRPPSPAREFERTVDSYRRQYDRGRTPPRNFWRLRRRSSSRGRVPGPPRRSRSPIPRGPARYSSYSRSPPPRRYVRSPSPRPRPFSRRPSPARPQYVNSSKAGDFSSTRGLPTLERRLSLRMDAKDNVPVSSSAGLGNVSESRSPVNHGAAYNRNFHQMDDAERSTVVEKAPGPSPRELAGVNTPVDIAATQGQVFPHPTSASLIARVERFNIVGDVDGPYKAGHSTGVVSQDADNFCHADEGQQAGGRPQLRDDGSHDHIKPAELTPGIETSSVSPNDVLRVDLAQLTSSSSVVAKQNSAFISSVQDLASNLSNTAAESRLADPHIQQTALAGLPQYRYVDPIDTFNVAGTKEDGDDELDERTQGDDDDLGEQNHANISGPSDSTRPPLFNVPNGQGIRELSPALDERSPVDHYLPTPSPTRKKTKYSRHQHDTQVQPSTPGKISRKMHTQIENSVGLENSSVRPLAARIGSKQNNSSPPPEYRDRTTLDAPNLSTSHGPSIASGLTTTSSTHERLQLEDRIAVNPVSSSNTNPLISRFNNLPQPPALSAPLPVKPASRRPGDRPTPLRPNSPSLLGRIKSPGRGREAERHWEPYHPADRDVAGHGRGRGRGRAQNWSQGSHSSSKRPLEERIS